MPGFTDYFTYSHQQADMVDFSRWLRKFIASDHFMSIQTRYLALYQRPAIEEDVETWGYLLQEAHQLETAFSIQR